MSRSLLFAGFLAFGGLAACDDTNTETTTGVGPQATLVTVTPAQASLQVGQSITLVANVAGNEALTDRTVTWSSSNSAVATVDANGVVRGVAAGTASIIARSNATQGVQGAAAITVTAPAGQNPNLPTVTISQVTSQATGQQVDLTGVQGQVNVALNVERNGASLRRVALFLNCPGQQPVEVAAQDLSGNIAPAAELAAAADVIVLPFNTAAFNAATGTPAFRNGTCALEARVTTTAGQTQTATLPNITLANQNFVVSQVTTERQAADQNGAVWNGGAVTVRVTPVIYAGDASASGTVTLTGTRTIDGTTFTASQPFSGTGIQTVTFQNSSSATNNVSGVTLNPVVASVTLTNASGSALTARDVATAFRLDNQAPRAGQAIDFSVQTGSVSRFIGSGFNFSATAQNSGFTTAGDTTVTIGANNVTLNNDYNGVDRVTVQFQYATITSAAPTCTAATQGVNAGTASSGLSFTTVTSSNDIPNSATNATYCLRAVVTDALQNTRNVVLGTFGVDRVAPAASFVDSSAARPDAVNDRDSVTVTGSNDKFVITAQDTGSVGASGFDATPVLATITRLFPNVSSTSSGACALGSFNANTGACSPVDVGFEVPVYGNAANSGQQGYFTFSGVVRDQAGNRTGTLTRSVVVDAAPPAVQGISLPATITGGQNATFSTSASDNLDLINAQAFLRYQPAGFGTIELPSSTMSTIGTAFDNTLTTSGTFDVQFANVLRSLSAGSQQVGTKPDQVTVVAYDAAGNQGSNSLAIPAANVAGTPAAPATAITGFTVSGGPVCNSSDTCSSTATTTTLSAAVTGATGTLANPFARVDFYYRNPTTGRLVFLGSTTSVSFSDNGAQRTITYTGGPSINPRTLGFANGSTIPVYAIGVTANNDGLITTGNVTVQTP